MPYKSLAQLRYLHAVHPGLARKWDAEFGKPGPLPNHVGDLEKSVARKVKK